MIGLLQIVQVNEARQKAEDMIRKAEMKWAQLLATPGKYPQIDNNKVQLQNPGALTPMQLSSMVDERYLVIGSHLDPSLQEKIKTGQYLDFARLLPRDRPSYDENRMELINKGGQTFFVPAGDRDGSLAISNFHKWEQAFRIFSNVYLKQFPHKATELLQYNHIIFTASLSFAWHNVYTYDKEFRNHLATFPERSWGIILQQAWSMCLKDKNSPGHESNGNNYGG